MAVLRDTPADEAGCVPRWSVIAPVRDVAGHLPAFLAGVRALQPPSGGVEVLVVDNGSGDASASIVAADPRVTLVREPTVGAYVARNTGLRLARGEFVAFTDPDCVVAPDWLTQYERTFRDPKVLLACGRRHPARVTRATRVLAAYEATKDATVLGGDDPSPYYGFTSNLAVRRTVFDRVGLFDHIPRGADSALVRRVVDRFGTAAVVFAAGASVTHLEFTGAAAYLRKLVLYAQARQVNAATLASARTRTLTLGERYRILRRCIRDERLGPVDSALLAALLLAGLAMWEIGALGGRWTAAQGARR